MGNISCTEQTNRISLNQNPEQSKEFHDNIIYHYSKDENIKKNFNFDLNKSKKNDSIVNAENVNYLKFNDK